MSVCPRTLLEETFVFAKLRSNTEFPSSTLVSSHLLIELFELFVNALVSSVFYSIRIVKLDTLDTTFKLLNFKLI